MAVITSLACGVCVHGLPNALQTYRTGVGVYFYVILEGSQIWPALHFARF